MTLTQLKDCNPNAHSTLVEMWAELSRCSTATAKRDLKENIDSRYTIKMEGETLLFTDTDAGDTFQFMGGAWE